jgi:hypothetical protein
MAGEFKLLQESLEKSDICEAYTLFDRGNDQESNTASNKNWFTDGDAFVFFLDDPSSPKGIRVYVFDDSGKQVDKTSIPDNKAKEWKSIDTVALPFKKAEGLRKL